MSVPAKNAVIDALKLPGTYIRAVGSTNCKQVPILQITHAEYKKFGEITDAQHHAEALYPRAKLSPAELRILLRRVHALYYNK